MSHCWNSRSLICAHKYDTRLVGWVLEMKRTRFSCTSTLCVLHTHCPNDVWGHTIYVLILTISTFLISVLLLPPLFCWPEGYIHTFLVERNFWIKVTCSQSASFPAWAKSFSSVMFERNNNDRFAWKDSLRKESKPNFSNSPVSVCAAFFLSSSPAQRETFCVVRLGWKSRTETDTQTYKHRMNRHSQHVCLKKSQKLVKFDIIPIM